MNFTKLSPKILTPRLPELGKIKIGGKGQARQKSGGKKGTYQLPTKFDHFVVTTRERGPDNNFLRDAAVHAKVGAKPIELDIRLMWDTPAENFQASLSAYDGKKRVCQGDGEKAFDRALNREIPCTCPLLKQHVGVYPSDIPRPSGVTCKPHGTLSVLLEASATYGGYYVFRTTSWETISSLDAALTTFRAQFGFLAFLPLKLVLYPTTDTYEEGGQTKTSKSYKVGLVVRGTMDDAYQLAATSRDRREQLLLAAPDIKTVHAEQLREAEEEEAADIAAEFHPETQEGYTEGPTLEAEFEVEEEDQHQEELIRVALEWLDWEQDRINRQLAKYSGNFAELIEKLDTEYAEAMQKAREEIERRYAGEDDPDAEIVDEDSDAEQGELL